MTTPRVTRELIDLTPKLAAELLSKNPGNRNLSSARVRTLAACILRGGWMFNGQPIIVDEEGNLLDGQHRCAAVVLAKRDVPVLYVRGVARAAMPTVDGGKARSPADVITASGGTSARRLGAILRFVWQYVLGVLGSGAAEHIPGNNDIFELASEHPEVAESMKFCSRNRHMSNAPVTFLHWATLAGNRTMAIPFWEAVATGTGLSSGSPALKLRDTLLYNINLKNNYKGRDLLEFCLRAWVCYLAGHQVKILRPGILESKDMRTDKGDVFIPFTPEKARAVLEEALRFRAYKTERKSKAKAS